MKPSPWLIAFLVLGALIAYAAVSQRSWIADIAGLGSDRNNAQVSRNMDEHRAKLSDPLSRQAASQNVNQAATNSANDVQRTLRTIDDINRMNRMNQQLQNQQLKSPK